MFSSRLIRFSSRIIGIRRIQTSQSSYQSNYKWIPSAALIAGVGLATLSPMWCEDNHQDIIACREDELIEGVLKKVQVGNNPENFIVVAKVNGAVYAVSGKCPHYFLPLNPGYLDGYTLICPFHGAQFDIRTGELIGAPGQRSLQSFEARISNGNVVVKIPDSKVDQVSGATDSRRLVKRDPANNTSFVIIGGGAAGQAAAETLRKEGFTGKITILTKETILPYDRVPLSKAFKSDASLLRDQSFYDEYGIEVKTGAAVQQIDNKTKKIKLESKEEVPYDKVLVATGAAARVPGPLRRLAANVEGIYTIRSAADHHKFRTQVSNAKDVVIFGSSFLGLEAAASIKRSNPEVNVTVIDPDDAPLERVFGREIAQQILQSHALNGIKFVLGQSAKEVKTAEGRVSGVVYMHTEMIETKPREKEIKADLVLIATGAEIQTNLVPPSLLNADGSVKVNAHLQTVDPYIFAAGDIASFYSWLSEKQERVEHWQVAQDQGKIAASNMLGKGPIYASVPFFWTNQFLNVQFAGFSSGHDFTYTETREEGSPLKTGRITYFYKNGRCTGVAAVNWPGAIIRLRLALDRGLMPAKEELTAKTASYETIAQKVKQSSPCACTQKKGCCGGRK
ncbi:unnamed protein product [Blepharisma stoltei]|uniref:Rieske domain-containing protein n=1 Tax=Blepharisma stoltei TaxID=1481888 RepID=A0AAU9JHL2_9CILI|nr:unnamed protein product [Blepharisma stoltei]